MAAARVLVGMGETMKRTYDLSTGCEAHWVHQYFAFTFGVLCVGRSSCPCRHQACRGLSGHDATYDVGAFGTWAFFIFTVA